MLAQYYLYKRRAVGPAPNTQPTNDINSCGNSQKHEQVEISPRASNASMISAASIASIVILSQVSSTQAYLVASSPDSYLTTLHTILSKRNLDQTQILDTSKVLGYISTICYTSARLPQLAKNYKQKSVVGLSMPMFISSILAAFFYIVSILFESRLDVAYILQGLPWLLGSFGGMFMDMVILCQFFWYRRRL